MSKRVLSAILLLVSVMFGMSAQRTLDLTSGSFSDILEEPRVEREIIPIENGYRVSYSFQKVLLTPDELFSGYEIWRINGFTTTGDVGMPSIPYGTDSFSCEKGTSANVRVITEEWVEVASLPSPGRLPKSVSDSIPYQNSSVLPLKRDNDSWFPNRVVDETSVNSYKDINIVNIGIAPVQFNVKRGIARICKNLTYEIIFSDTEKINKLSDEKIRANVESQLNRSDEMFLSAYTLNWNNEHSASEIQPMASIGEFDVSMTRVAVPKYLIIATSGVKEPIERLANWKRQLGYDVTTAYKSMWKAEDIQSKIQDIDNLSYVLLVGNNNQVVSEVLSYDLEKTMVDGSIYTENINVISDNILTTTDYSEAMPEICIGRLPVNNATEASRIVDRIINYEKTPSCSSDFYNSSLFLSSFIPSSTSPERTDVRNSQTSYEISKYLESKGRTVNRMFKAKSGIYPLYWSDAGYDENGNLESPARIPFEMRKHQYEWKAEPDDILSEMNKGYSQVFYFSHGSPLYWDDLLIGHYNFYTLNNEDRLPLVFCMSCDNFNIRTVGSIGERFFTAPNGGAIGAFGFTNATYAGYTDLIAISLYNGMWPNPGVKSIVNSAINNSTIITNGGDTPITELGKLHLYAIQKMRDYSSPYVNISKKFAKYQSSIFSLFGDPSMNIYLEEPKDIKPVIMINGNTYRYSLPAEFITTIYNGITGEVNNYKGSVSFTLPLDKSQFHVTIHSPGYRPYVFDFSSAKAKKISTNSDNKMVREDRVWKYWSLMNNSMEPSHDINLNVKFSGTTEINGLEYHNCYAWRPEEEFSENTALLLAYMREEGNKVFVKYYPEFMDNANAKGIDVQPYAPMSSILTHKIDDICQYEMLVFDTSLAIGDKLMPTAPHDKYSHRYNVEEISEYESEGSLWRMWKFDPSYHFVENIGGLCGLLPFPAAFYDLALSKSAWELQTVEDLDGNVIFSYESFLESMMSKVTDIDSDIKVNERYFNIDGSEITKPEGNGIYIKVSIYPNGKVESKKLIVR